MTINQQYKKYEDVGEGFWLEVNVKYNQIIENRAQHGDRPVQQLLNELSAQEILDLAQLLGFKLEGDVREKQQQSLFTQLTEKDKLDLLMLRDFQNRRKRTIQNYYRTYVKASVKYDSVIIQLLQMLRTNPSQLSEIFTLYIWENRATGDLYTIDKELTLKSILSIVQDEKVHELLKKYLEEAARDQHKYKLFSYIKQGDKKLIVLVYKQVGDITRPDMVKAIRHRDVMFLLFAIDVKEKTFELKLETGYEDKALKQFIEHKYKASLQLIKKEVFKDYSKQAFEKAVLEGGSATGKPVEGLLVTRVCFAETPLKNSPEVTIGTENLDVWVSVMDAHQKKSVSIESLKDLKSLSLRVNGINRQVRSVVQENGDVVFTMDDRRLDSATKEYISEKFQEKFGVPLFQPISNEQFAMGQADKVDYIMSKREQRGIEVQSADLLAELKKEKYVTQTEVVEVKCTNPDCDYEEQIVETDAPELCGCGTRLKKESVVLLQPNMSKIKRLVEETLLSWTSDGEWKLKNKDAKLTVSKETLSLFVLERKQDGKVFQVHVTDRLMAPKMSKSLNKRMTPTLLIFVGQQEKSLDSYSVECMQAIGLGRIYYLPEANAERKEFYSKLFDTLDLRSKNFMASAANQAYESIREIVVKGPKKLLEEIGSDKNVSKEYERDFEDNVYALFKDMLPNAIKWGHEKTGQALPEGTFAFSFQKKKGKQTDNKHFVFSYDCKFTKDEKGYNLGRAEQRKALEYVKKLSGSDYISTFSSDDELSGHIFVSNAFRKNDYVNMKAYFEELDGYETKPIFMTADALIRLHELYRTKTLELEAEPNMFKEQIYKLFMETKGEITSEHIEKAIEKLLDPDLRTSKLLNSRKLTDDLS